MNKVDAHAAVNKLDVVPPRRSWQLAGKTLFFVVAAYIAYGIATRRELAWDVVGTYMLSPLILKGLFTAIQLTIIIMMISIILGGIIALMQLSKSRFLQVFANLYTWFFRGTPALVQLILWFNLAIFVREISLWIPFVGTVFTVDTNDVMTPFVAAVVALSLHEAGYMAEIIRAGIQSVPPGQIEAAESLGMGKWHILRRIVVPQSMRVIIPPTGNETIGMLKSTSLVSTIAVPDILYQAQQIYNRTFEVLPLLMVVTAWYLFVVSILSVGQGYIERHYGRSESGNASGAGGKNWFGRLLDFGKAGSEAKP